MIGYLCAIGIAFIFLLGMDGNIGVMMLAFLLLMPVISTVLTLLVRKRVHLTLTLKPDISGKRRDVTAEILLEKDSILPMPFLRVSLQADAHFAPLNAEAEEMPEKPLQGAGILASVRYQRKKREWKRMQKNHLAPDTLPLCLSMGTAREKTYEISLRPEICGLGNVSLSEPVLSDFLGIIRFRLKWEKAEAKLLIQPEIPEIKPDSALFRTVSTAIAAADEETEAEPNPLASSVPGYEHRDYIPGDSLKRINWKLSVKRRQLMVRKDEPVSLARMSVVLDFRRAADSRTLREKLAEEEQMIETALGFLMLCSQYGFPCSLSFADEGGQWSVLPIDSGEQLAAEAVTLLRGGFRDEDALAGAEPVPPELLQDAGVLLLYFTVRGEEASAILEPLSTDSYLIVPAAQSAKCRAPQSGSLWLVMPDRSLEPASK